jgi:hypothetical protein
VFDPSRTASRVNKGMKKGWKDRSGNVHGYRIRAMDCLCVSLSWACQSRNAWPLPAKARSWPLCRS